MCMHRMLECHVHLFIRMFPTGPAVMRPVPPRCDRAELIRREGEERDGGKRSNSTPEKNIFLFFTTVCQRSVFPMFIKSINKASHT